MAKPAKRIPVKTRLHLTFCARCLRLHPGECEVDRCDKCFVMDNPTAAAEAAREFVAKEKG